MQTEEKGEILKERENEEIEPPREQLAEWEKWERSKSHTILAEAIPIKREWTSS